MKVSIQAPPPSEAKCVAAAWLYELRGKSSVANFSMVKEYSLQAFSNHSAMALPVPGAKPPLQMLQKYCLISLPDIEICLAFTK